VKLYPAIDIRNGNVVRLAKGDFDAETIYGDSPVAVAHSFVAAGTEWIHIVDLDGAKSGSAANRASISEIARSCGARVQTGGGVRSGETVEALIELGVDRVVLGTLAIEQPELTRALIVDHPDKLVIGLDARDGKVAAHGWTDESESTVEQLIRRFSDLPVASFVITDISRDGMLSGPDLKGLTRYAASTDIDVIASGGVSSLEDLQSLSEIGVAGVIVGKALYEGRFELADALRVVR
jgi:phosphoribosylformimino-5-aminoimidazole carboxamide ribotide isomerase